MIGIWENAAKVGTLLISVNREPLFCLCKRSLIAEGISADKGSIPGWVTIFPPLRTMARLHLGWWKAFVLRLQVARPIFDNFRENPLDQDVAFQNTDNLAIFPNRNHDSKNAATDTVIKAPVVEEDFPPAPG